ncbi:MAG: aldo/keto reductase [Lachnospiraceae bacterium]|nr:aldo/keto reductase [Lachnospiraceae bacterium]
MEYRLDKYGNKISVLGYGCMRFSQKITGTDVKKTNREIMTAIKAGVNYFDTAYIYPGSEKTLGLILQKNKVRDKVRITTKLPHYLIKSVADAERMFQEELKRLRTDHVECYLMHMLTDVKTWERLCSIGIDKWIAEKKKKGQIEQIGFSYHGNSDMFIQLVDAYDWDVCQIQYNYLDEHSQAGVRGLKYAASKGIPVVIMEPLRGGRLVNKLPKKALKMFDKYPVKRSPAEWAFRWLWNQPEVTCVLSGMNSVAMVKENVASASASRVGEFTKRDFRLIDYVKNAINKNMKVGCTGCRYCMPCPRGVDVPGIFAAYNRAHTESWFWGFVDYMICTSLRKDSCAAENCIGCGKCERHCPQGIKIREELQNARKEFEGPLYKIAKKIVPIFMKF